jgi:hypothetical protein
MVAERRGPVGTGPGGARPWLLAVDTATSSIVVAAGRADGSVIQVMTWAARHRHGELLLAGVEQLLAATGLARRDLAGVIVGIGPGAFTGLRVGLATAKTLAHAMHLPIAGVGTGEALLAAVEEGDPRPASEPGTDLLLLPAGPHDRVEVRPGAAPRLLPGGTDPRMGPRDRLVAVDLDGRAPDLAAALGAAALDRLGATLLRLGAARLSAGTTDDPERLVPEYVTLPRGVKATGGEIAWSTDPR